MNGTGVPIVTPFDASGSVDTAALCDLVTWLEDAGIDFLVPCGSTGEAPLLSADERATVIETVVDATDLPVLAGTGLEGYEPTLAATERAAAAGADAALVLTPSYYATDGAALEAYYRDLADESPLPVYLYSVPKFTGRVLSPETVASLAPHDNVAGIKDSGGAIGSLQRTVDLTADESFDVLVGHGSVYAAGLDAGADGGVLGLAHVCPERTATVYDRHAGGDQAGARRLNADLVACNRTVVGEYGVPGVKAALDHLGLPAGRPRRPLQPVDEAARAEIEAVLDRSRGAP